MKGKEAKPEPKQEPPPSRTAPGVGPSGKSRPYDQWSFGLFGGTGSRFAYN